MGQELPDSWRSVLEPALETPEARRLGGFLRAEEAAGKAIYPPSGSRLRALELTPLDAVKVVILGQDPYHGPGQAMGLSFSVPDGVRHPPSLRNIFKELADDCGMAAPTSGDLTPWAQRGVLLIGNPLTMLLGLPALLWCLAAGAVRRDWTRLGAVIGYAVSLGLWLIAPKPVQFYYHYFVPHFFLLAALALACSDLRRLPKGAWLAWAIPAASVAMFAWFFPIIAALPLKSVNSFVTWTWLAGWQ